MSDRLPFSPMRSVRLTTRQGPAITADWRAAVTSAIRPQPRGAPVMSAEPSEELVALAVKLRSAWIDEPGVVSLEDCSPHQEEAWLRSAQVAQDHTDAAVRAALEAVAVEIEAETFVGSWTAARTVRAAIPETPSTET